MGERQQKQYACDPGGGHGVSARPPHSLKGGVMEFDLVQASQLVTAAVAAGFAFVRSVAAVVRFFRRK